MSLFKYFNLESGLANKESEEGINSGKRPHSQCNQDIQPETSTSEQHYENKKRKRLFVHTWTKEFMWLHYDKDKNIMICRLCTDFPDHVDKLSPFYVGTSTFRKSSIKTHANSKAHAKCQLARRAKEAPKTTPMAQTVAKMNKEKFEVLRKLFRTAYCCKRGNCTCKISRFV